MTWVRTVAFSTALVVLMVASATADDNSLRKGSNALQFEINQDFDLTSFQGTTISWKKHTSRKAAWRIGLDASLDWRNRDNDVENDITSPTRMENDNNNQLMGITTQRIYYSNTGGRTSMFYGLGPHVRFSHSHQHQASYSDPTNDNEFQLTSDADTDQYKWAFGLTGVLGVEWFVNRTISLLAEYGSRLEYTWTKTDTERTIATGRDQHEEYTDKLFQLDAMAVKFGVSAYW